MRSRKLIVGALYLVETVEDTDSASNPITQTLRWTSRGWRDVWGRKPRFSRITIVRRVLTSAASTRWKVMLLREYAQKLEAIGDGLAFWCCTGTTSRS